MSERAEGFAAIPNWMIRDESISPYSVAVHGALASHTGPGGVRPSQPTLVREARCSERKVRDALDELRALGVVEVVRRRRAGGKSTTLTNGYVLHPHGALADDEESMEVPARDAGTSGKLPARGAGGTGTSEQIETTLVDPREDGSVAGATAVSICEAVQESLGATNVRVQESDGTTFAVLGGAYTVCTEA